MSTTVQKWGNSQGLRLAKHLLERPRIAVGDDVEVKAGEEEILIKKVSSPKFDI
jgi:antitoxin MazE